MRVAIAADHNGFEIKARLTARLVAHGHEVVDCGANSGDGTVNYPPLCQDVSLRVADGRVDRGIIVGGSGQGEHIACNKVKGVRAGLCHDRFTTEISRGHNDSNVLILGSKVIGPDLADELTDLWMAIPFKGGVHQDRLDQIAAIERGEIPHRVKP
ncbi:MAG: RpiB/LacA/LacB family sugar-phosphate isomerase [Actinocrinis sp.]